MNKTIMLKRRAWLALAGAACAPWGMPCAAHTMEDHLGHSAAASRATPSRQSLFRMHLPLVDQDGRRSDWADLAGAGTQTARIMSMFYSRCDMVCPMLFEAVRLLESGLAPASRARLQVSLVTLDPEHDDPAALKKTAAQRAGDPARWRLYRPAPQDVRKIAGMLGVQYRRLDNGEFSHSTPLVLVDAQGVELARTDKLAQPEAAFQNALRRATG